MGEGAEKRRRSDFFSPSLSFTDLAEVEIFDSTQSDAGRRIWKDYPRKRHSEEILRGGGGGASSPSMRVSRAGRRGRGKRVRGMLREPHPTATAGTARPEPRAPAAPLGTPRTGIPWRWCTSVCG